MQKRLLSVCNILIVINKRVEQSLMDNKWIALQT